ncbi:hypothetical protein [Pseudobacillus badius]|uniref:DinB/UmuC family translesion DNA polymerase n=2 Tax=Pseudobacillus TaxID=108525 RepID=UPI003D33F403
MGINSVYDLAHADKYKLKEKFGVLGLQMFYHSWGVDYTILSEKVETKSKSYSKSQILMRDYYNEREILIVIHEMVDEVAMRLRSHRVSAGKIALAISYSRDIEERGFKHQMQLPRHTNCTKDLNTQFEKLFKKHWRGQPVRQIFVVCGKLEPALYEQIDLFSTNEELEKKHALDEAMDEIRFRFGKSSIFWAHSLLPAGTFLKRANTIGGHKG